jgi:deazaflavin-dependent oxidoreductase (nitroreductase family)
MTRLGERLPVQGFVRWALRAPIWLYRHHLGWLFGHSGLLLTHQGRKSGRPRQTVLEVARYDKRRRTYIVAAGWGLGSDWLRNIQQTPRVWVRSGRDRLQAQATILSADGAAQEFRTYLRHHPLRARAMSRLLTGQPYVKAQAAELVQRLAGTIPVVALAPAPRSAQEEKTMSRPFTKPPPGRDSYAGRCAPPAGSIAPTWMGCSGISSCC